MRARQIVQAIRVVAALGSLVCVSATHAGTAMTGINLGTAAPPASISAYEMTAFPLDRQPFIAPVASVVSPLGGVVGFDAGTDHRRIGTGWASWSHGYTGDVYYNGGGLAQFLTMPANTGAFYVYVEGNGFVASNFSVVATNDAGATSTVNLLGVQGQGGAAGVGFFSSGSAIASILIANTDGTAAGFSVGEFGIALLPGPGDLNGDGVVNTLDLGILLAFWGPVGLFPLADINGDGVVNSLDLGILLASWTL